ncbi:DUF1878 family protein [Bacillus sp. JJ1764]|uniref:DUF1878 family protein n=1 Tax=Bacillus sp. JJ1764 TaxID=3122964 RepID=UPI0030008AF1
MNEYDILIDKIEMLEFHQRLLLKLIDDPRLEFYRLLVENRISEHELKRFLTLCDELSKKLEEQRTEGYVYFHPLYLELAAGLPEKLEIRSVIQACFTQKICEPLFKELAKYT